MKALFHITDRSKLDEIVCIVPAGHKDNPSTVPQRITRLENLERRPSHWHRTDVVLVNRTRSERQYCLDVTASGFAGALWILDMLDDEQYATVIGIAERMRENARNYDCCKKLLV